MKQIVNKIVIGLQIIVPLSILIAIACAALMLSIKLGDLQDFIRRMRH